MDFLIGSPSFHIPKENFMKYFEEEEVINSFDHCDSKDGFIILISSTFYCKVFLFAYQTEKIW